MLSRKEFLHIAGMAGIAAAIARTGTAEEAEASTRPNILWLSTEDIGPHLGCYGDPYAKTPTLDGFAARGIRYTHAFTVAPVCAPNRSSIITGVHATTLGTHHMRSGGEGALGSTKPGLPPSIRCFPEYLRDAGYYCTNNSKEDYNFSTDAQIWDESSAGAHWRNRSDSSQPFFAVFNYQSTHEGSVRAGQLEYEEKTQRLTPEQRQDPEMIVPPPYHPNTPEVRRSWANYYELITGLDYWVADRLAELEAGGLAENTIVFFWSDHGAGLPRCKRWPLDSGTHVPWMVYAPDPWQAKLGVMPGTVEDRLVASLDLAPTVLQLAGLPVPGYMQGQPFFGADLPPGRHYVHSARDRMDERYDMIRSVRDKQYRYVRNYEPFKPCNQFMDTAEKSPVMQALHRLAAARELAPAAEWVTRAAKPAEELYDTIVDPDETTNLAGTPVFSEVLARMRAAHETWTVETRDLGLIPEPILDALGKRFGSRYAILPALLEQEPGFFSTLRGTALRAGDPQATDTEALLNALQDARPAVVYWAATGLGNLKDAEARVTEALRDALADAEPVVRVAAAAALFKMAQHEDLALDVLTRELQSAHEWVRLQAAIALDTIGEKARPALPLLENARNDSYNKYVARVADHALSVLKQTQAPSGETS